MELDLGGGLDVALECLDHSFDLPRGLRAPGLDGDVCDPSKKQVTWYRLLVLTLKALPGAWPNPRITFTYAQASSPRPSLSAVRARPGPFSGSLGSAPRCGDIIGAPSTRASEGMLFQR